MINPIIWVKDRIMERTSWDGMALMAVGIIALMFAPLVKFAAYGAITYGVWTLWKKEK